MPNLSAPVRIDNPRLVLLLVALVVVGALAVLRGHHASAGGSVAQPPVVVASTPAGIDRILRTQEQRASFERVLVKLGNVQWAEDQPYAVLAAEAQVACRRLDTSVPLLAAIEQECGPLIAIPKLVGRIKQRCQLAGATEAKCERLWQRIKKAYGAVEKGKDAFAQEVGAIPDESCRSALTGYPDKAGMQFGAVATDALHIRVAIHRADASLLRSSVDDFARDKAQLTIPNTGLFQTYIDRFRGACHLAHTKDPPLTTSSRATA